MNNYETTFKGINFYDENGNIVSNPDEYMKKVNNSNIENLEQINVGDIVQIKNTDYLVEVKYVEFNIPDIGTVDYAGKKLNDESANLVLFNKKDIAKVMSETEMEKDAKKL